MMIGDDDTPIPEEIVDLPFAEGELPPAEVPAEESRPEFLTAGATEDPTAAFSPGEEPVSEPGPDDGGAAAAVEDMLSAEMLPEGLDFLPEPSVDLPQQPTFQAHLRGVTPASRTSLKKALDALGAAVPDSTWTSGSPVVSQLTEFQLVSFLQIARALGIHAEASVVLPDASPSEDDLALGDLSLVADPITISAESAPSVTLPKGEKEVMLCTPDQIPGGSVRESLGIVLAHRSIARRIFREEDIQEKLQKELRTSSPGRSAHAPLPSSQLQIVLRDLMVDLRKAALSKGGNAVLGLKLESFPESGSGDPQLEQMRLVAFGTAAVVDKS